MKTRPLTQSLSLGLSVHFRRNTHFQGNQEEYALTIPHLGLTRKISVTFRGHFENVPGVGRFWMVEYSYDIPGLLKAVERDHFR